MMRNLVVAVVLGLAPTAQAAVPLLSGALLTNFASATFSLPSGVPGEGVKPGIDPLNVGNGFTRWILVTANPQLCMRAIKQANLPTTPPVAESGQEVCFTIWFINCGVNSAWGVTVTDRMPVNTIRNGDANDDIWVNGGIENYGCFGWSTDNAAWNCSTPAVGQAGPLYLRWVFEPVGPMKSGFVKYCLTIQ